MKKFLAIVLTVIMLLSSMATAFAANGTAASQLRFDENGKFKILLFADIQDGYPLKDELITFMNEALDKTQPDLVIFLGDNVMGPKTEEDNIDDYYLGYEQALTPLVQRGIPFSFVFGNHDDENMPSLTKEQMLAKYQEYPGCLAYDADPELHGCATHNIEILSSSSDKTAFNLWLMDSGDYVNTEDGSHYYDCVRKDQIEWYQSVSKELEAENGAPVPSFVFQHIVPADVAQQVMVTLPFHIGALGKYDMADGTSITYLPNLFGFEEGVIGEAPCPSIENDGQWDAMVERGDVLACFFGHDHVNTYTANVKGIDATNVPGATFKSYHSDVNQGAVLLTLDENDLSTYEKETVYVTSLALEEGSQLPGISRSKFGYVFFEAMRILLDVTIKALHGFANYIVAMPY